MKPDIFRIVMALSLLLMAMPAQADYGRSSPYGYSSPLLSPTPAHVYSGRSYYYRAYPREDPEPFRCLYAADSTCPGRYDTGFGGDPRDDPEPFRCTYAADAGCPGGGMSGIQ
jgi:hypothetical protein